MIKHSISFDDYCEMPQLNASLLAASLDCWADFKWQRDNGYHIDPNVTRVGTAAHLIVEYLPVDKFADYFCVMPDYHLSPFNVTKAGAQSRSSGTEYVREMKAAFADNERRTVLTQKEYDRLTRIIKGISANPEAMELIKDSWREETVDGLIEGVPCKGRVDGLVGDIEWDLKTCHSIDERSFSSVARRLRYLFKDAFRTMLLAQNEVEVGEFKYIVALDERVADGGKPNHAPSCVVVDVPIVCIENYMGLVQDKVRGLRLCEETDRWPGRDNYTLQLDTWDMPDITLVD